MRSGNAAPLPRGRGPHGPCAGPAPIPPRGRPSVHSPCWPHGARCHYRICYSDTSSPQEDQYPPNIAVKVNHSYCSVPVSGHPWAAVGDAAGGPPQKPFPRCEPRVCFQGYYPSNKPGVEPKRPCRPINLTHLMYLSSATNRITVTWGNYGKVRGARPPAPHPGPLQAPPWPDCSFPTSAPRVTPWPCTWCGS